MNMSRLLTAAAAALLTGTREPRAQQQSAPLFSERFANMFDPGSRTYFSVQGT